MDPVLFEEMGTFSVNEYHDMSWSIFWGEGFNIALDNVLFQIDELDITANETKTALTFRADNTFLVDSYFESGYDLTLDGYACDVLYNERLENSTESVSRLLIECDGDDYDSGHYIQSMEANATAFVNHFSATK